ncbi:MAG: PHP domain-containing protein [Candidatus Omnitrophica bacterium]|nr:PHP domain-containing protein [Candidatus Omnitrophota bacterium]
MKCADLHLHTVFSDGTFTPRELIQHAKTKGLSAISIVDHDTVAAIRPAIDEAREFDIEIIPGIELTAEHQGKEVHILGYLIDYTDHNFKEKLDSLKQNRIERIYKMTEKLKDIGIILNPEKIFALASFGTVGRLHVARQMVKEKIVSNTNEAFRRFIGEKGPGYVSGFKLNSRQAIDLIKSVKGVPVLAHPYMLYDDELVLELIGYGIMGLEAYYAEHSQSMVNSYLRMAKEHGLLVTGGSDCHGDAKPRIKIGSIKIPYSLVEALKAAQVKL